MQPANGRHGAWQPLGRLLAEHAASRPRHPAIVDVESGRSIAFGELQGVVDGVAAQLLGRGLRHGMRVVLLMDEVVETLCVWLALWRIGAVVCPMDRSQIDASATRQAVCTLRPEALLYGPGGAPSGVAGGQGLQLSFGRWPCAPDEPTDLALRPGQTERDGAVLGPGAAECDLAAACCTSGTSGRMKIILHDHRSYWLNGLDSMELLDLGPQDRMLEYRSFSWYSPQILSLMPMLQCGLSLHVAREFSATRFAQWVADHAVTVSVGVPTVLNILLRQPEGRLRPCASSLRLMTSSSAPLSAATWSHFERQTGIAIVNLYGSSEGGWICGNRSHGRVVGSVGLPTRGISLKVVDGRGRPLEPGQVGEVVVEGQKLAVGMLQPDGAIRPIRGRPLCTNDIGQQDEHGVVRILGRRDQLIIRGGVKVSPVQIEDAVLSHPDVAEAAVTAVPDEIYGQEIVCFVVFKPGAQTPLAHLISHAAGQLARDRLPRRLFAVSALPRNSRGKVRIDLLRERAQALVQEAKELKSPHAPMSNCSLPSPCA